MCFTLQQFESFDFFRTAKPKSAAQLKKEAKKKEKMEKFLAKKQKIEQNKTSEVKNNRKFCAKMF